MLSPKTAVVPAIAACLLLIGCGQNAASEEGSNTDAAEEEATERDASERSGPRHLQGTVNVDREVLHPNGSSVRVTGLSAEGNAVYVDIEGFNGYRRDVTLVSPMGPARLLVDGERDLLYQQAEGHSTIAIPSAGELTARLAFVGRLPPGTATLDLHLNWPEEGPRDDGSDDTDRPSFRFTDLPVPGGSAKS